MPLSEQIRDLCERLTAHRAFDHVTRALLEIADKVEQLESYMSLDPEEDA